MRSTLAPAEARDCKEAFKSFAVGTFHVCVHPKWLLYVGRFVYIYIHIQPHVNEQMLKHIYIYVYMYIYIYIHIHTHIYTHAQTYLFMCMSTCRHR